MELLQTLSPSASHCIKCFCNFIRILCLCRCQSAMKLKLQTEILHFHLQWKLRKSIFLTGKEIAWPCQLGHSLLGSEGSFRLLSRKGRRKVVLHFCHFSLASWSTNVLHGSQERSFWALLNITHFSFSLFHWVNWGCAGEALVLDGCRNVKQMLTLTLQSFPVGREGCWWW